jgi:hypothetical protein
MKSALAQAAIERPRDGAGMAKRDSSNKQTQINTDGKTAAASDAMEQRLVAFAEQIGRIAGTVSARTEGLMDREALKQQIAGVRDSATQLLEHLSDSVNSMTGRAKKTAVKAAATAKKQGRGLVDAPGKKHRKPMPKDPRAIAADTKHSLRPAAKSSMKPMKRRGRG